MAGIIPRNRITGVDFCGSKYYHYIIRSDLGCYMRSTDLKRGSDLSIYALHPACQNGDHYIADADGHFYIIKGKSFRRVTDLSAGYGSAVFSLHPQCQGGDHYLAAFGWFHIIFKEKGTYRRTSDLSQDADYQELPLPPDCRDGLYYWGLSDHFSFLRSSSEWGAEYCTGQDFQKDSGVAVYSVHPDVLNFLPGALPIANSPVYARWDNIQTVINDSPTPVTWQRTIAKKVGYKAEMMSQITHNWKMETSGKISAGKLARLIALRQFSFSSTGTVRAEKENWDEETVVEEQLSLELKPKESLYLWQFQMGLGSEPVLFCRNLRFTKEPYCN